MSLHSITVISTVLFIIAATQTATAGGRLAAQVSPRAGAPGRGPASPLTLERALDIAERQSPQLRALGQDENWAKGRLSAARVVPNPEFALLFEDLAAKPREDEASPGNIKAELSQPLELGGKRSARIEQAEAEAKLRLADSILARSRFRFEIGAGFVQLVHSQHLLALAKERHELTSRIADVAGERARAGKIAPIEETRLRTNAAMTRTEVDEKQQELSLARLRLASIMGIEQGEFGDAEFPFEQLNGDVSVEKLRAELLESGAFERSKLEIAKTQADLGLERANSVPDLTLVFEANYQPYDERTLFAAGFSLPLPLFDRNQGGRAMATAQVATANALAEKQRRDLVQEFEDSSASLTSSLRKARLLKSDVLPGLEQSLSALEAAYRQGRIGYLDVVESQESLFAVREKALDAAARYHTSLFKLEALIAKTRMDATAANAKATDGVTR